MFPISYRDLEFMLPGRGVEADHTTIFRSIQAYAVEPGAAHSAEHCQVDNESATRSVRLAQPVMPSPRRQLHQATRRMRYHERHDIRWQRYDGDGTESGYGSGCR